MRQVPLFLGTALSAILNEDISGSIGVQFQQQERRETSVPDGLITQRPLCIYFETKNYDWFYDEQLKNHIDALYKESHGLNVLIALGNFDGFRAVRFEAIETYCKERCDGRVRFASLSFEEFLAALRIDGIPAQLVMLLNEFEEYLNGEGLLPAWKYWLDVVNCAGLPEDVLEAGVYMCPASGGAYSHSRCAYFGMYREKNVECIAEIRALVDVETESNAELKWKNNEEPEKKLLDEAISVAIERRPDELPVRVFLLGDLISTDFRKISNGGMMSSKRYFDIREYNAHDAEELAARLKGKTWE